MQPRNENIDQSVAKAIQKWQADYLKDLRKKQKEIMKLGNVPADKKATEHLAQYIADGKFLRDKNNKSITDIGVISDFLRNAFDAKGNLKKNTNSNFILDKRCGGTESLSSIDKMLIDSAVLPINLKYQNAAKLEKYQTRFTDDQKLQFIPVIQMSNNFHSNIVNDDRITSFASAADYINEGLFVAKPPAAKKANETKTAPKAPSTEADKKDKETYNSIISKIAAIKPGELKQKLDNVSTDKLVSITAAVMRYELKNLGLNGGVLRDDTVSAKLYSILAERLNYKFDFSEYTNKPIPPIPNELVELNKIAAQFHKNDVATAANEIAFRLKKINDVNVHASNLTPEQQLQAAAQLGQKNRNDQQVIDTKFREVYKQSMPTPTQTTTAAPAPAANATPPKANPSQNIKNEEQEKFRKALDDVRTSITGNMNLIQALADLKNNPNEQNYNKLLRQIDFDIRNNIQPSLSMEQLATILHAGDASKNKDHNQFIKMLVNVLPTTTLTKLTSVVFDQAIAQQGGVVNPQIGLIRTTTPQSILYKGLAEKLNYGPNFGDMNSYKVPDQKPIPKELHDIHKKVYEHCTGLDTDSGRQLFLLQFAFALGEKSTQAAVYNQENTFKVAMAFYGEYKIAEQLIKSFAADNINLTMPKRMQDQNKALVDFLEKNKHRLNALFAALPTVEQKGDSIEIELHGKIRHLFSNCFAFKTSAIYNPMEKLKEIEDLIKKLALEGLTTLLNEARSFTKPTSIKELIKIVQNINDPDKQREAVKELLHDNKSVGDSKDPLKDEFKLKLGYLIEKNPHADVMFLMANLLSPAGKKELANDMQARITLRSMLKHAGYQIEYENTGMKCAQELRENLARHPLLFMHEKNIDRTEVNNQILKYLDEPVPYNKNMLENMLNINAIFRNIRMTDSVKNILAYMTNPAIPLYSERVKALDTMFNDKNPAFLQDKVAQDLKNYLKTPTDLNKKTLLMNDVNELKSTLKYSGLPGI